MRPDANDHVEVAARAAGHAGAAFVREADPRAITGARRDLYFEPPRAHNDAASLAGVADGAGDFAATSAGRADLLALEVQRPRRPRVRLLERNLGRVLDVLAAHGPT